MFQIVNTNLQHEHTGNENARRAKKLVKRNPPNAVPLPVTAPPVQSTHSRRSMTVSVTLLGLTLLTVLTAYVVFGDTNDQQGLNTLRMIGVLFRHGDRAPSGQYPNDPHKSYEWPGGLGALSETGSLQMYNLGHNLRQRYYKLLPPNGLYNNDNMFVLSSAAERCLMSAAALLAGFMPPLETRSPLPILWQPVPINSIPRKDDHLLALKKPCAKYDESLQKLLTNDTANAELYAYLTKHTGKNITNLNDVDSLYDLLYVEQLAGLVLPEWTEVVFPDKMLPLAKRNLALRTETPFMKKLRGGALLTEILDNMTKKRSNVLAPNRSVFLYSGHDLTLVSMMRALGIIEYTAAKPDYAATLVIEMHHNSEFVDDFEIKIVYYFNSEDRFPKAIPIPDCSSPCSLTQFTTAIERVTLRDYDEICRVF